MSWYSIKKATLTAIGDAIRSLLGLTETMGPEAMAAKLNGITKKAAQTYTPGTTNQTINAGQYLSGAQTIKGDANLVPANIAKGVSIFGVAGSHEGGGVAKTLGASATPTSAKKITFQFDALPITSVDEVIGMVAWTNADVSSVYDADNMIGYRYSKKNILYVVTSVPDGRIARRANGTIMTVSGDTITLDLSDLTMSFIMGAEYYFYVTV